MMDHKRELAEWCWQHQLPPPLYDREAVGPSTQVLIIAFVVFIILINTISQYCCSNQGEDTSFMFCLANGVSTEQIED